MNWELLNGQLEWGSEVYCYKIAYIVRMQRLFIIYNDLL